MFWLFVQGGTRDTKLRLFTFCVCGTLPKKNKKFADSSFEQYLHTAVGCDKKL
jgi:hypothetical protein